MTTFTNGFTKDYPKSLRFHESFLGSGGHYGRVTFHCGDDEVECFKLTLVLASKFWKDLLENTGNENVDIMTLSYVNIVTNLSWTMLHFVKEGR